jgi:hypothetical protein
VFVDGDSVFFSIRARKKSVHCWPVQAYSVHIGRCQILLTAIVSHPFPVFDSAGAKPLPHVTEYAYPSRYPFCLLAVNSILLRPCRFSAVQVKASQLSAPCLDLCKINLKILYFGSIRMYALGVLSLSLLETLKCSIGNQTVSIPIQIPMCWALNLFAFGRWLAHGRDVRFRIFVRLVPIRVANISACFLTLTAGGVSLQNADAEARCLRAWRNPHMC